MKNNSITCRLIEFYYDLCCEKSLITVPHEDVGEDEFYLVVEALHSMRATKEPWSKVTPIRQMSSISDIESLHPPLSVLTDEEWDVVTSAYGLLHPMIEPYKIKDVAVGNEMTEEKVKKVKEEALRKIHQRNYLPVLFGLDPKQVSLITDEDFRKKQAESNIRPLP